MKMLLAIVVAMGLSMPVFAADDDKPKPEEAFKKLDTNADSKLSKEEFVGKKAGEKATKAEELFKKKDKNNDGFLDLEEFKASGKKDK